MNKKAIIYACFSVFVQPCAFFRNDLWLVYLLLMLIVDVRGLLQSLKTVPPCHQLTSLWMPMQDAACCLASFMKGC